MWYCCNGPYSASRLSCALSPSYIVRSTLQWMYLDCCSHRERTKGLKPTIESAVSRQTFSRIAHRWVAPEDVTTSRTFGATCACPIGCNRQRRHKHALARDRAPINSHYVKCLPETSQAEAKRFGDPIPKSRCKVENHSLRVIGSAEGTSPPLGAFIAAEGKQRVWTTSRNAQQNKATVAK